MYKPVNMKDVTYDRLSEICDRTQFSKMAMLEMLINELYVLVKPINQCNIEFSGSQVDGILRILVRDRNKFIVEQFDIPSSTPNAKVDRLIAEHIEKVKKQ